MMCWGGIGVECAVGDVGAVGEVRGVGGEKIFDDRAELRIVGERGPFVEQRDQHIPVHDAALFVLASVEGQRCTFPKGCSERKAVVVFARRADVAHLKERSRAKDTVVVIEEKGAVGGSGR